MPSGRSLLKILIYACGAVTIVEIIYWIGVAVFVEKPDSAGTFGDMFGALSTFFAGLAFVGVIYTLYTQVMEAAEARRDQLESLGLIQSEVGLLREEVDLQRRRDHIHASPFFRLISAASGGQQLDFEVENVGAPVIVKDFQVLTTGCAVRSWSPSTLPEGAHFTAPCYIPSPSPLEFNFRMVVRDRWGKLRTYDLRLETRPTGRLDFSEIEHHDS
jgi:hypothetical protein